MEILKLDGNPVLSLLSTEIVQRLIGKLQAVVKIVTLRIRDVRMMRQAKEYNIKCMIDSVGGEKRWRASKLVNAISRAKCEVAQMSQFIEQSLGINKKVCLMSRSCHNLGKH